ncbi:MAG: cytidine deaminase [Bacillota bacterium]|jgi:cytidine deaminase
MNSPLTITDDVLVARAKEARQNAYAPYSGFKVGAAVVTDDGRVFTGVNVESVSYGLTCCAERVAVFKAVSEGSRRITAVAVVAGEDTPAAPCGACRQIISEFGPGCRIVMEDLAGHRVVSSISEYLPAAFGPRNDARRVKFQGQGPNLTVN